MLFVLRHNSPVLWGAERDLFSGVQMPNVIKGLPLGWDLHPSDYIVPISFHLFDSSKYGSHIRLGDTG